ncbi:hypothetical protein C3747_22g78 [Trypanosoma cruzi]|uniref:BTB domain-containing protein n=2 Tax=Trypanosoma cruzi TaxID=5693 RepID=Q4DEW3_TRYCC|nr:hypothetical protein, conserved [Trypanosoma cruzi]EAN91060.1 hypothetical protein, conserved [Trypanosoma cruzi]PWV16658.1 hypothetical protein C3747_22g78 [Trypanosoma cruzi]RNC59042.1 hypothetical protein TcCL_ESM03325 [Trypanosoma cruzi]|eukprot:XP_812911.1 hypothetical protein [Trypanosoma cruzi strain CL Brener]
MRDSVDASEIKALLQELEGVVGSPTTTKEENERPFSPKKRGSSNVDVAVSRYAGHLGQSKFSTYANTTNDSRRAVVPLWERLPPVNTVDITGDASCPVKSPVTASQKTFLRPKLVGGAVGASLQRMPLEGKVNNASPPKNDEQGLQQTKLTSQKQIQGEEKEPPTTSFSKEPLAQGEGEGEDREREVNFLPIMCARYINPAGITPRARWGHTLTPMQGQKLLLFGGMEIEEGETASLFEYDTHHISWDPVCVSGGVTPTPRTNHAACASGGRWLYISGGTTDRGTRILGDLYCYDIFTQEWTCLWEYGGSSTRSKHEPTPRFGHSMVSWEDRLYIFGGKTPKRDQGDSQSTQHVTVASTDVYVFSLTSRKWKRRIHAGKTMGLNGDGKNILNNRKPEETPLPAAPSVTQLTNVFSERPANRFFHAACVLGDCMYINGGTGDGGVILSDTWFLDLRKQHWVLLHNGRTADSFPREKHHLFACGEALLVVGGCSASSHSTRITLKYHNFVAVLPFEGNDSPCWIPVAMGNVSIVAPNRKSFGAAFAGGFVHVFGGVSGSEPASNSMVRFLAADGYFETDSRSWAKSNADALTSMMRHIREASISTMFDTYAIPRSWDGETGIDTLSNRPYGVHRGFLQQRAPKFWEDLKRCRMEHVKPAGTGSAMPSLDLTDPLKDAFTPSPVFSTTGGVATTSTAAGETHPSHAVAYFTEGNSRIQGLSVSLSAEQLQCLLDYIYWGDVRHRILLEQEEEEYTKDANVSGQGDAMQEEAKVLQALRHAADVYDLNPLMDICDALLARSRKKLKQAHERSTRQLQADLLSLLESSNSATATVLFVDPHTKQKSVYSLHPFILMAASSFFNDLLRPLVSGEKTTFQVGPVAAKMRSAGRGSSQTRRDILVGPVSVPYLAVKPLLRFLYTQRLTVPREAVFATLLGSHLLDVAPLQAYCESILAREEVNYDTAGQFYSLGRKYHAPLLQETALLTAVLGYAEVCRSPAYKALSEKEAREIDAVAHELGATSWIAPPQAVSEVKPAAVYQLRWNASSPLSK